MDEQKKNLVIAAAKVIRDFCDQAEGCDSCFLFQVGCTSYNMPYEWNIPGEPPYLRDCPFCGGKAKLVIDEHENSDTSHWHSIRCTKGCGANMGEAISAWAQDYNLQVQALANRWNRKA